MGARAVSPGFPVPGAVPALPGAGPSAREAGRWVRALAAGLAVPGRGDMAVIATGLLANAVLLSRSGAPGGTVTVIVTADGTLHVRDRGTPGPCPALAGWPLGQEGFGRGLAIAVVPGALAGERPGPGSELEFVGKPSPLTGEEHQMGIFSTYSDQMTSKAATWSGT